MHDHRVFASRLRVHPVFTPRSPRVHHTPLRVASPFHATVRRVPFHAIVCRNYRTRLHIARTAFCRAPRRSAIEQLEFEQSVVRTPKRRRARSPEQPSPTKRRRRKDDSDEDGDGESAHERSGRSFRKGATTFARVICAICLGRHSIAKVGLCQSSRLWNGNRARAERVDKRIRLINGGPLCISWQRQAGCSASDHPERHRCSGCGREGHGASGCPLAEAE
ncbi:hypothetical protein C8Q77DRAFT_1065631 [Trametes polyzona]|nr:hypothetical protein C8Q77DRAFT_1065631 [Trametes polyzona]